MSQPILTSRSNTAQGLRRVPIWHLAVVVAVYSLLAIINVNYVFAWTNRIMPDNAIGKLLGAYLPHLLGIVLCIVPLIFLLGELRFVDIGLSHRNISNLKFFGIAAFVCVAFWLVVNLILSWRATSETGTWEWSNSLAKKGAATLFFDLFVTQLVGNAMVEEVVFRGYLYRQLKRWFDYVFREKGALLRITGVL